MGRAPCCDKANVKKGPWSPEEDAKLKSYIEENGTGGNWIALPQKIGLRRCGKSCRLRWLNYLRPNIKHGGFSEEEDNIICSLYVNIGSRWSIIAAQLPGRTDNDIKNYWNTRLKKKLLGKHRKEHRPHQLRRANQMRQEIKLEETHSCFTAPAAGVGTTTMNHIINPQSTDAYYWPEIPSQAVVVPPMMKCPIDAVQDHNSSNLISSENQESLKNLLIKLGGRFSDQLQQDSNNSNTMLYPDQEQTYANNSTFEGLLYGDLLDEMVYGSNQQQPEIQEMGSFYGSNNNNNNGVSSGESSSTNCWGNNVISSSCLDYYPKLVSEFENCLQNVPQDHHHHNSSCFEVSSYFGPQ